MFDTKIRLKNDVKILDLVNSEIQVQFNDTSYELRNEGKQ